LEKGRYSLIVLCGLRTWPRQWLPVGRESWGIGARTALLEAFPAFGRYALPKQIRGRNKHGVAEGSTQQNRLLSVLLCRAS